MTLSLHKGRGGYWWLIIQGEWPPQAYALSPEEVAAWGLDL